jgi:hypothetical protein
MRVVDRVRPPDLLAAAISVVLLGVLFHISAVSVHDAGAMVLRVAALLVGVLVAFRKIKPAAILSSLDDRLFAEYTRRMKRANAGLPLLPPPLAQEPTADGPPARHRDHPLWDRWLDG